jgi:hypothetical protein
MIIHNTADDMHAEMMHEQTAVDMLEAIPTVSLSAFEDPKSGWNLHIDVENFVFAPQNAGMEHVEGEGHAHLYVDGEKITRLYAELYYLSLDSGMHDVVVTLNGNNHNDLTLDGVVVQDSVVIVVE